MRGRHPKPPELRQNRTKKAGRGQITAPEQPLEHDIPNPDGREWQPLTVVAWNKAWASPMASQWLETDADALGRLALLWDQFYNRPSAGVMAEIRLQEQRFGLSPLDRSRLQWEVNRGEAAEQEQRKRKEPATVTVGDPRKLLRMAK